MDGKGHVKGGEQTDRRKGPTTTRRQIPGQGWRRQGRDRRQGQSGHRQTDRQTETGRELETDRETDRHRHTDTQIRQTKRNRRAERNRQTETGNRETERGRGTETHRHTDRDNRQTETKTEKQTGTTTERERGTQVHRHRGTEAHRHTQAGGTEAAPAPEEGQREKEAQEKKAAGRAFKIGHGNVTHQYDTNRSANRTTRTGFIASVKVTLHILQQNLPYGQILL